MRILLVALMALAPTVAAAQGFIRYYPPASGGGGGASFPLQGGTGCTDPFPYGFTADTNAGMCLGSANQLVVTSGVSGARGYTFLSDTASNFYFIEAGGQLNGWYADANGAAVYTNNNSILKFGDTLGSGFLVGQGGATDAVARTLTAGNGISIANGDGVSGNPTISADTATTPQFSSGTGDVPATGALGTFYFETDVPGAYTYPATDTETWLLSMPAGVAAGRLFQTTAVDQLAEITPTDDTVIVSNGSTWEKKTLPDCDDSGGNHVNYDTTTNAFSCGTSGGASSNGPRPNTRRWVYASSNGDSSYTNIGMAVNQSGSPSAVAPTASVSHMTKQTSAASSGSNAEIYTAGQIFRAGRTLYLETYASLDSTADQRTFLGFNSGSVTTDDPAVNIVSFRCSSTASDTNWTCVTNDGTGGGTINDSGIACNTTAHKFAITENPSTSFVFAIDGSTVCTNTTNLPTGNMFGNLLTRTTTATAKAINIGYLYVETN